MALGDILEAIRAETAAEIAQVDRAGEASCAAVHTAAATEAAEAERLAAGARRTAGERAHDRIVNRARLAADRQVRAAAEEVYQEAVAAAGRRLAEVRNGPEYAGLLATMIQECIAVLPDARYLEVDPADVALTREIIDRERLHQLRIEPRLTTDGGLVLATDDGRAVVNTFEARLRRADGYLRQLAAELIPALHRGAA
jgi:vacuolar-type H+-ATPase subunit E/Vma4